MSLAIHLLNRPDETGRPRLLSPMGGISYKTCCWKLSASNAADLIGGRIYLHDKKSEAARIRGVVTAVEPADEPAFSGPKRFALTFASTAEAKKMRWRGASHAMAWTGGVVEADAAHEVPVD